MERELPGVQAKPMLWIETKTADEARELQQRMWQLETRKVDGAIEFGTRGAGLYEGDEFWSDAIAKLKDDPDKRLSMAKRHLPLPAAFREAAVALRAIIRGARRDGSDYEPFLRELYRLAAIWSFYIPYAPRLQQPGYNVIASVPFFAFAAMDLTWQSLGYEKLALLTKTDRGWMIGAWGEPLSHTTAHDRYRAVWDSYELALMKERR